MWFTVPDVRALRTAPPISTAFMDLRAREAKAAGKPVRKSQRWINYGRISPALIRAVLVSEDAAFWSHDGVDLDEIKASIEVSIEKGTPMRGASTITQQLAKNLYLSPSRNPTRKLTELFITRRLEAELSKRRILELYLNVIEWGDGIWGCDAAARAYFGVSASDLSPSQAALMAAVIINPRRYSPAHPSPFMLRRQALILRRMGEVTPPQSEDAPRADKSGVPIG
ncbi:MAG: monofunctional biosynthetic peptidoglycan transglycosylase [Acidobacteriota bacterium]